MPERYTAAPAGTEEFVTMLESSEWAFHLKKFKKQLAAVSPDPKETGTDPNMIFDGLFANPDTYDRDAMRFLGRLQEVLAVQDPANMQKLLALSEIPGFQLVRSMVYTELGRKAVENKSTPTLPKPEKPQGKPGLHEPNL